MPVDPITAFRCPPELREQFKVIAHRHNRSVSGELRELMRLAVEADERLAITSDVPAVAEMDRAGASEIAAAKEAIG